jgi:hypothetical protein
MKIFPAGVECIRMPTPEYPLKIFVYEPVKELGSCNK